MPTTVAVPARAFDADRLCRELGRVVARVCPTWLAADRDDLIQAAAMRLLPRLHAAGAEGTAALSTSYLYRVAHSVLVDEIRRVRRRRETELGAEPAAEPSARAQDDPERAARSMEIGRGIQSCLAGLAHDRRLAVTLYLQGHTVPEAAKILDWPEKRTENLVYRGLADLRACLSSKGLRP
jgi:RNA polymerase sigma-70 factor (ECF subfamily)